MKKQKISGFSIIELIVIISLVVTLLIVSAPSFYGIFKKQFMIYDTNYLIQNVRTIQTNAFKEHKYYKITFNNEPSQYTLSYFNENTWETYDTITIDDSEIAFKSSLNNSKSLIYGPNGNAYTCNTSDSPTLCTQSPLNSTASIALKHKDKEIIINFLPISGYVSSNISVR